MNASSLDLFVRLIVLKGDRVPSGRKIQLLKERPLLILPDGGLPGLDIGQKTFSLMPVAGDINGIGWNGVRRDGGSYRRLAA